MSVKSKHSSKKGSVVSREKKKKMEDSDEDIESSEEELDLTKECHPIGFYMNDRAEMINQMFSVIKGNKLKAMLPPVLKDCDIEQLKLQCLDQLLGMSEKRIKCILEGEVLDTSSESEVAESDLCDSDEKNGTSSVSSSNRSNNSQDDGASNNMERKRKKRKKDLNSEIKAGKVSKTESEPVEQGKTLLEILELEMRARAIRALLKQSGNEKGSEQTGEESKAEKNSAKELSGEIVDLTECEDEEQPGVARKELQEAEEIDKKVSNFEKKIEKSKVEKPNPLDDKSKRLQAELELRNKLFKKKIYRTRQQRMENEDEEKNSEKCSGKEQNSGGMEEVVVKQEPAEPEEIVVEDPEEGEVSTSEDDYPVEIKQEPPELVEEPTENQIGNEIENNFETKMDETAERVTAIDNGMFVRSCNMENSGDSKQAEEVEAEETKNNDGSTQPDSQNAAQEVNKQVNKENEDADSAVEETSWRDRWLQKDGVQKMVKSSKIYAKVKKRIAEKSQKAREDVPIPYEANSDSNSNSKLETIEGSIEEYERLLGRNHLQKEASSKSGNGSQTGQSVSEIPENLKADKT